MNFFCWCSIIVHAQDETRHVKFRRQSIKSKSFVNSNKELIQMINSAQDICRVFFDDCTKTHGSWPVRRQSCSRHKRSHARTWIEYSTLLCVKPRNIQLLDGASVVVPAEHRNLYYVPNDESSHRCGSLFLWLERNMSMPSSTDLFLNLSSILLLFKLKIL